MIDWTDRLSDYLDGETSGEERQKLEAALEEDAELRRVLEEIRTVRDGAASLPHTEPEHDLWPGIEARIREKTGVLSIARAGRERRRFSFTAPQLAAAAVALMVLGSGTAWVAMGTGSRQVGTTPSPPEAPSTDASFVAAPADASGFSYEATIRDLEERVKVGRSQLSPETVQALETSLATIDRAIARAQEALKADPANVYLNRHLAEARTRKLYILQQAAMLSKS